MLSGWRFDFFLSILNCLHKAPIFFPCLIESKSFQLLLWFQISALWIVWSSLRTNDHPKPDAPGSTPTSNMDYYHLPICMLAMSFTTAVSFEWNTFIYVNFSIKESFHFSFGLSNSILLNDHPGSSETYELNTILSVYYYQAVLLFLQMPLVNVNT